jgi:hypothetical protein
VVEVCTEVEWAQVVSVGTEDLEACKVEKLVVRAKV